MRLFVAFNLPESVQRDIQNSLAPFRSFFQQGSVRVRWVRPGQYHLTLKFLGEQPDNRAPLIQQALGEALRETRSFSLTLAGFGCFPVHGPPQTLWMGVDQGSDKLKQAVLSLEETLAKSGYPKEKRPFHGHLTLGRIQRTGNIQQFRASLRNTAGAPIGPIPVTSLDLMQSRLGTGGPVYRLLGRAALKTG
ncbi:MAG: RNA 2',3'-cyclic phosphodiesterase [Elusimicrobiota bacterium]